MQKQDIETILASQRKFFATGKTLPVSWRLEYKAGEKRLPVKNTDPYEIAKDKYCTVHFQPVRPKALRLTAQLQEGKSAGTLEWKVR